MSVAETPQEIAVALQRAGEALLEAGHADESTGFSIDDLADIKEEWTTLTTRLHTLSALLIETADAITQLSEAPQERSVHRGLLDGGIP
jgi:hypothetical protein